jgi:hypothetical protein
MLVINIKNSATCFGSLSHHQAKYETYLSNSWLIDSCTESRMTYHVLLHYCADFRCILYKSLFSLSFFLYENLISSLSRIVCIYFE